MLLPLLLIVQLTAQAQNTQQIHPDSISFGTLNWEIPDGKLYRSTIDETPFYYAENSLPLFSLRLVFKSGEIYGQGENGVSALYQYLLESGGTEKRTPTELDSLLDLHAINLSVSTSNSKTTVSIDGLKEQFPRAMTLLREIFESPLFDKERLVRDKAVLKERISHRFDNPGPVMNAVWLKMHYPGSIMADLLTDEEIDGVTRKDLKKFHKTVIKSSPLTVAFAGAVKKSDVEKAVRTLLPKNRKIKEPVLNEPQISSTHKVILVHKPINQAYIKVGQPLFKRPDKRYYPLTLFNDILGGGGFNSRLVTTVRSNAGLTYSISSSLNAGYLYDGTFSASLFTKSESVNHALKLTLETIKKTVNEELKPAEIEEKKMQFVTSLPSSFRSGSDIVATYQNNEVMGRDIEHYRNYPKRLNAVSTETVIKTSAETINPDEFYMVIVGDTTELMKAPEWNGFSLKSLNPTIITEEELLHFNEEAPVLKKESEKNKN